MFRENQKNKPIILIGLTIVFVLILAHFLNNVTIFGYTIKPVDLFMDIKPDSLQSFNINKIDSNKKKEKPFQRPNINVNTAGINNDNSLNFILSIFNKNIKEIQNSFSSNDELNYQTVQTYNIPLTGNIAQMKYFFDALKNAGKEKIRVAHFGDSANEGDAITANIREVLQEKFGGKGVGFLSITSQDITFRTTTKQSFSNNWTTASVAFGNSSNLPLGMNGDVSVPQGVSWVQYQTTNWLPYLNSFNIARVIYSNAKPSSIKYSFNNQGEQTAVLQSGNTIRELKLNAPGGSAQTFKFTTTFGGQAYFYGVSLEDGNGVYVDNFPWRGNTGLGFTKIPESSFLQFGQMLNYKLIILGFGGNETSFSASDNEWYEDQMIKVINNLKKEFPQTSILMLGVGDRGKKKGTRIVTDPNVPLLIKVQEEIANKTGIAFWNLFEAQGGYNSMERWVNANPPLAYMDYIHPSWQGAAKIGDMIGNAILQAFYNYK